MSKKNFINILDFGSSKIRFAVFDKDLVKQYSATQFVKYNTDYSNHLEKITSVIKQAEKSISMHIKDIILSLDHEKLYTVDLSLSKILDRKIKITKLYDFLILELRQIFNSNYNNFEIIHIVFNQCIIDNKSYNQLPKHIEEISNIKVDFKIISFPKKIINNIKSIFAKVNVNILNFFCTSYIKSSTYLGKLNLQSTCFLEIGYNRSNFIYFEKKQLKFINSIPIGGMHITKDISEIFKIAYVEAENIKRTFNKSETEFSFEDTDSEVSVSITEILKKKIPINLLKKVILYRVQEIIELSFKRSNIKNYDINLKNLDLFFIGEGSVILNENFFHLSDDFEFKNLNFFEEKNDEICKSILVHFLNNYQIPNKINKKIGVFEKFFNFFSK